MSVSSRINGPERWRRVSQAFDELCDLPAEERPARLAQLERESPEVAVEVGAMLAADRTNRGAMADGALPFAAAAAGVLTAGARLGPYEIVAPLGAGGWGRSTAPVTRGWIAASRSR
jgi:hypothetical protein